MCFKISLTIGLDNIHSYLFLYSFFLAEGPVVAFSLFNVWETDPQM